MNQDILPVKLPTSMSYSLWKMWRPALSALPVTFNSRRITVASCGFARTRRDDDRPGWALANTRPDRLATWLCPSGLSPNGVDHSDATLCLGTGAALHCQSLSYI